MTTLNADNRRRYSSHLPRKSPLGLALTSKLGTVAPSFKEKAAKPIETESSSANTPIPSAHPKRRKKKSPPKPDRSASVDLASASSSFITETKVFRSEVSVIIPRSPTRSLSSSAKVRSPKTLPPVAHRRNPETAPGELPDLQPPAQFGTKYDPYVKEWHTPPATAGKHPGRRFLPLPLEVAPDIQVQYARDNAYLENSSLQLQLTMEATDSEHRLKVGVSTRAPASQCCNLVERKLGGGERARAARGAEVN
ncbi:hypothetical protein CYMTET_35552 [Cymbomonas tetramitiformis]|uniref:Uncharacterized protein n=1 Tax=Cymbomonas tetramitiformis TaxID=36881 RepID=A0AAE0KNT2_9CHLO|nr:hypothetical protein CYMTET_35552 [Cymbomonas tetramitiformis]